MYTGNSKPLPIMKPCEVCDNMWDSSPCIICACCGAAAHEGCYGVAQRDGLGRWMCHRCLSKDNHIKCEVGISMYLPSTTLPFTNRWLSIYLMTIQMCPVEHRGLLKPLSDKPGSFVHAKCAIFIPELAFNNTPSLEPVSGYKGIEKARFALRCSLCKISGGAPIQCRECKLMKCMYIEPHFNPSYSSVPNFF